MGSSPSKGKPLAEPEGKPAPTTVADTEKAEKLLKKSQHVEEVVLLPTQDVALLSTPDSSGEGSVPPPAPDPDVVVIPTTEAVAEMETPPPEEIACNEILTDSSPMKIKKKRKPKGVEKRQRTELLSKTSFGTKVDPPPPHMVRAHQAAYAYLNPSISRYDTLLGLLDKAAQTHLSLQPMMSNLVLHFEEINQALEEMAEEGELMMQEHGDHMAWPATCKPTGPYTAAATLDADADADATQPGDPPPDLLQQLLRHSTEKMRLVGGSFQAVGNAALEEKVEHFAYVSRLLVDKLRAKQAAEGRLGQVLLYVEQATARGSRADDLTMHSEDSGIGGENESLAGSERLRGRHRGSAGSGSCGSGGNVRASLDSPPHPIPNRGDLNEGEEEEEEDEEMEEEEEEEDDEENEEGEGDRTGRKRSNSSPPDPSRPLANPTASEERLQRRRPMTAAHSNRRQCSPSSCGSDPFMELQMSQRDLDQRMRNRTKNRGESGSTEPYRNTYRVHRQRSLSGSGADRNAMTKWPLEDFQLSGGQPDFGFAPRPPGRDSVRRLINTFSRGVDGRPGQPLANIPPHIKRPHRSGALILPDRGTAEKMPNGNNNNNSWPESRDNLDADSLPPPPPEVLMDDSFQSTGEDLRRSVTYQRTRAAQRLRASVQNVSVLPNRAVVSQSSAASALADKQDPEQFPDDDAYQENETGSALYRQAQKIIHLRDVAGPLAGRHHRPLQREPGPCHHYHLHTASLQEAETAECSSAVTAPPVSRVRLPPSCPSVHHRFPSSSQAVALSRPTSPRTGASSWSSSPRMVAMSRPSSPRTVVSAGDYAEEEIVPMVAFSTARSVFCQMENQRAGHDWNPSTSSTLPRLRGDPPRGRQATRGEAGTFSRRTQSEQRSSVSSQSEEPGDYRRRSIQARNPERLFCSKAGRTSSPSGSGGDGHSD